VVSTYALLEGGGPSEGPNHHPLLLILSALVLLIVFIRIEARAPTPLIPIAILRQRNLLVCCITNLLFSVAGTAAVLASLYLQLVRHYDPLKAGITFLPLSLSMALFSLGPAPRLVTLFNIRWAIAAGLLLMTMGLVLLGYAPTIGGIGGTIVFGLILMGVGNGIFLSPLLVGAMNGISKQDIGVVSGLIGTTSSIGRALGLALLVHIAAMRTEQLSSSGQDPLTALNAGYHAAFFVAAWMSAIAAIYCSITMRLD
jgi:hypothetical protein